MWSQKLLTFLQTVGVMQLLCSYQEDSESARKASVSGNVIVREDAFFKDGKHLYAMTSF